MRLTKIGDWIKYVTESGKTFFYNDKTNDFQWDNPAGTGHEFAGNHSGTATLLPSPMRAGILCFII